MTETNKNWTDRIRKDWTGVRYKIDEKKLTLVTPENYPDLHSMYEKTWFQVSKENGADFREPPKLYLEDNPDRINACHCYEKDEKTGLFKSRFVVSKSLEKDLTSQEMKGLLAHEIQHDFQTRNSSSLSQVTTGVAALVAGMNLLLQHGFKTFDMSDNILYGSIGAATLLIGNRVLHSIVRQGNEYDADNMSSKIAGTENEHDLTKKMESLNVKNKYPDSEKRDQMLARIDEGKNPGFTWKSLIPRCMRSHPSFESRLRNTEKFAQRESHAQGAEPTARGA